MVTPSRLTASRTGLLARLGVAAGTAVALVTGVAPAAQADDTFELATELRQAVNATAIMDHLAALDSIGAAHDGTRASGTTGYKASVDYVVSELKDAGYKPTTQAFQFPFFQELSPSRLESGGQALQTGAFTYSGSGEVTAAVQGVDLALSNPSASTSGCEAGDFTGFTAGSVALVQRGACTFATKAAHAADAGATAVIIFNQGTAGREGLVIGTLGGPLAKPLPVVGATFADGQALSQPGTTATVVTDTISEMRTTWNVFAETKGGDPRNVVMAGAHLDSVAAGPGVNDNGSGSASILEVAKQLAEEGGAETNKVRFAWWGAEELGKLGSVHYVNDLKANKPAELDKIALYLNFDMVGSPNYVRFVYDGDNSRFPVGTGSAKGPQGSAEIEALFHDYFASQDLASEETPFSGRSDYGPFIEAGVDIPSGGLFTGAEGVKTEQQAAIFGGQAGVAYDVCYHQACDGIDNVNPDAIAEMSGAVAHAVGMFAVSTHPVNGQGAEFPAGGQGNPVGTGTAGGGGLHDDHDEHHQTS